VSRLGAREMGEVLTVQAGEMLRIWRLARHSMRGDVLPGCSDGPLETFFGALGPLLTTQARPGAVVGELWGLLRLPPQGGPELIAEEWEVARQVLRAACDSLGADAEVAGWLDQAAVEAEQGVLRAVRREPGAPRGLVRLQVVPGKAAGGRG
jgi:hypothetical protein